MARFLHLADIHLGTNQYHNAERNSDFFKAFWGVIDRHALRDGVDFVLLAGDLFDKRQIDAPTLGQATAVLRRLADAGIPVCCVEGNHDRAYYGEGSSWLEYLNGLGLLRLLRNDVGDDGQVVLRPWQAGQRPGAYTDIGDVRVIGSRYYGASTAKAIAPLADAINELSPAPFTVLVWHMGLEGYINPLAGGVSLSQLAPLRGCTDYLALGHVHQRYTVDDWLYNPGSLEACNVVESTLAHGAFLVTVDHHGHRVEPVEDYPRRPFHRLSFDLTPFDSPAEFQDALPSFLAGQITGRDELAPVIELSLTGTCRFSRSALDLDLIRQIVITTCMPLLVLLRNLASTNATAIAPDAHTAMDRRELETYILQDVFAQDSRFRAASDRCSQLLLETKHRMENGEKPTSLLAYLKEAVPQALRREPQNEVDAAPVEATASETVPPVDSQTGDEAATSESIATADFPASEAIPITATMPTVAAMLTVDAISDAEGAQVVDAMPATEALPVADAIADPITASDLAAIAVPLTQPETASEDPGGHQLSLF